MIATVAATDGLLVMADISGYTAFVSGTEHEHSREILAELIENIAKSFGGKLSIDQVDGDALCCTITVEFRSSAGSIAPTGSCPKGPARVWTAPSTGTSRAG